MAEPPNAPPIPVEAIRWRIQVQGIVQGVGFRPFVYTMAQSLGLAGHVFNSTAGVTIEIEGDPPSLARFLDALKHHPPPLASIGDVSVQTIAVRGEHGFTILESHRNRGEFALIPPDAGTCNACWREIADPPTGAPFPGGRPLGR